MSESEGLLERESRMGRVSRRGPLMEGAECVLLWAEESESWVLQGQSQPVRLRDCRPRHKSFASGRPREESCAVLGKSILLVTVSSESWKSALERKTAEAQS